MKLATLINEVNKIKLNRMDKEQKKKIGNILFHEHSWGQKEIDDLDMKLEDIIDAYEQTEQLSIHDFLGSVAAHMHYDLSLKAMQLMKENTTMKVEDFKELPEVKKLWGAIDVIKQHYL